MTRAARIFLALLVGFAAMAWTGHRVLVHTTGAWFSADLGLRSRLAVESARRSLVRNWDAGPSGLSAVLSDIARDERILGVAACTSEGTSIANSPAYPPGLECPALLRRMREEARGRDDWSMEAELPTGPVHVHVRRFAEAGRDLGTMVLVHDLSFVERREGTTATIVTVAFFLWAILASAFTVLAMRYAWQDWTGELQKALAGPSRVPDGPPDRDVRAFAERFLRERTARGGTWCPERLREVLAGQLDGEKVVLLSNREPYVHETGPDGVVRVLHPASGLVTALEPVMRACSGVWVAHGSGSADRSMVGEGDRIAVPPGEESYLLRRVWLSAEEEKGYYYGLSNEGLWPLCHFAHERPLFRSGDWEQYVSVNRRFADAVCEEASTEEPIVLVQDYHFALAPRMIRERLPRATILTFWHIPWPSAERIGICPWREEILSGLLGSSILGFHTRQHCNNFLDSVDAFVESRIDRETSAVHRSGQGTLVRAYPISIEWPPRALAGLPGVEECRREVRERYRLAADALLGVGVDRLDYTKGIEERLQAVDELLARHPELRGRFSFLQIAAPSRTRLAHYRQLDARVTELADEINARWATQHWRPVLLERTHHDTREVYRLYRAADLCYVSSLHDGMNLVAKEFVAARDDEDGVLLLSRFTGAARELPEALVVNPYDLRQASEALAAALRMPPEERRLRMQAMRRSVAELNVYRWAGKMLVDAATLRSRERFSDPFQEGGGPVEEGEG